MSYWTATKRCEIAGSHRLTLDYQSACSNIHGHNWIVEVVIAGSSLNRNGMLLDFKAIKDVVHQLDHRHLNDVIGGLNPTAENLARWIADEITKIIPEKDREAMWISQVSIQESEGNTICYCP